MRNIVVLLFLIITLPAAKADSWSCFNNRQNIFNITEQGKKHVLEVLRDVTFKDIKLNKGSSYEQTSSKTVRGIKKLSFSFEEELVTNSNLRSVINEGVYTTLKLELARNGNYVLMNIYGRIDSAGPVKLGAKYLYCVNDRTSEPHED